MKEFDYIILGGGCAGLSLAYELDINKKLNDKTLAIIETRDEYKRDKTWSFWKVTDHNFDDCVIKSWNNFSVNSKSGHSVWSCSCMPLCKRSEYLLELMASFCFRLCSSLLIF